MHEACTHPQTLKIISDIAGVELVPVMDVEVGNINISVKAGEQDAAATQPPDDPPVTLWHRDSYPFVCVVMMSDASKMRGGETALRTGSGDIVKVRGPEMVTSPSSSHLCPATRIPPCFLTTP